MGYAADGFSSILLLSEEHEFAFTASCGETGNDVAGDIRRSGECVYQRVRNHKSKIFRKYTKRHTIINITARAYFGWKCSKRISQRSIATRRARICHHKNEIFRKSTKRPAIINIQRKPVSHGACSRRIFQRSIATRRARICPHGELQRNWE